MFVLSFTTVNCPLNDVISEEGHANVEKSATKSVLYSGF